MLSDSGSIMSQLLKENPSLKLIMVCTTIGSFLTKNPFKTPFKTPGNLASLSHSISWKPAAISRVYMLWGQYFPGINRGGPAPEGEVKSKEARIGDGVEGAAEVMGLCDGEDMKSESIDADEREVGGVCLGESWIEIGLLEWYPTVELGMMRGERQGHLCVWMDSPLSPPSKSISRIEMDQVSNYKSTYTVTQQTQSLPQNLQTNEMLVSSPCSSLSCSWLTAAISSCRLKKWWVFA